MKFYYLHTMELAEAASGDTKLVLESDYNAKIAEKDAEIVSLKLALEKAVEYYRQAKVSEAYEYENESYSDSELIGNGYEEKLRAEITSILTGESK